MSQFRNFYADAIALEATPVLISALDSVSNPHPAMPSNINHLAAKFLHRVCGVSANANYQQLFGL